MEDSESQSSNSSQSTEDNILIQQFSPLTSIQASIRFTLEKSIEENKTHSCQLTVLCLINGLRLRGQKFSLGFTQTSEQHKKLVGGIHQQIQQQLKKAKYFSIGIRAFHPNKPAVNLYNYKKTINIVQTITIKKSQIIGNHFILFHKKYPEKDIYYVYQSWQDEFSLQQWIDKSDQFQSISTQLYQEKIYPYQNPLQYVIKYFQKLKQFKMAQINCPRCGQIKMPNRVPCICVQEYYFLRDDEYIKGVKQDWQSYKDLGVSNFDYGLQVAKLQELRKQALLLTEQQFIWGKRMKNMNTLDFYITSLDD